MLTDLDLERNEAVDWADDSILIDIELLKK